jgi:Fringe-like
MFDVAIVVKTGAEVSGERLRVLREKGWMSVGRRVPNLLVIGDREAPGVVGMKRYGTELLLDEERHAAAGGGVNMSAMAAAATVGWSSGNLTFNGSAELDVDALDGGGVRRGAVGMRERPRKWFEKGGWRGDKDKNLPAFHLLRTVYPGKKWYIMVDDDTYLFLDHFAAFAKRHEAEVATGKPLYTGKIFFVASCGAWGKGGVPKSGKGPQAGFAHGGSGIVMNGAAMDRLYGSVPACMRTFSSCWAGDMQVALCLRLHGVEPARYGGAFERHFHPFSPSRSMADSRYVQRWLSDAAPMSYHKLAEGEVALVSEFERAALKSGTSVRYAALLRFLLDRGVRPTYSPDDLKWGTHKLDQEHDDFVGFSAVARAAAKTAGAKNS